MSRFEILKKYTDLKMCTLFGNGRVSSSSTRGATLFKAERLGCVLQRDSQYRFEAA